MQALSSHLGYKLSQFFSVVHQGLDCEYILAERLSQLTEDDFSLLIL